MSYQHSTNLQSPDGKELPNRFPPPLPWLSNGILLTLTFLFLANPPLPLWVQYAPFVISMLVLGLPHGAVDHLVLPRLRGKPLRPKEFFLFLVAYLTLVALYLLLWFWVPAATFILFIGMTWFHWGQGDLYTLLGLENSRYPMSLLRRILTVLVRGGLPMLVPLLAFPDIYQEVARDLIQLFDPKAVALLESFFSTPFRQAAQITFLGIVLAHLSLGYLVSRHHQDFRLWQTDVVETVILATYFWFVPPMLAIGMYFCLWHSLRHIVRVLLLDPSTAMLCQRGEIGAAIWHFSREAFPFTTVALLMLLLLYVIVPRTPSNPSELIALYLALIAALTLPHIVVVTGMDLYQNVWLTREETVPPTPSLPV